ncbi:glycosyltransferase family protein [Verrucomicrobia bacterium]|nr:glycosyltransferase family protein [Verrucomicrobiota bacterium]MDG1892002.1 glycosyltransferase family protein [Verrucomicrobiota bacterium]
MIQARMTSTRLPNKVLLPLVGKPVLEHIVTRLQYCRNLDQVIVLTSVEPTDDPIEQWCSESGIDCFRGSLLDVLDRYYKAAIQYRVDVIVRITGDCPVADPRIVDEVIDGFFLGGYEAYGLTGEFPDGLDCQVFALKAIERAWHEAVSPRDREHPGAYIEVTRPDLFRRGGLVKFKGLEHHRWTLDEPRDYVFLKEVFARLHIPEEPFLTQDILGLEQSAPELFAINADIKRNEAFLKSMARG